MNMPADAELITWEQARTLAAALPGLRKARGWTQKRLAQEAGVLPSATWQAEQANHRTALVTAGKIGAALGTSLEELAGAGPAVELTERQRTGLEIRRLRRERGWSQKRLGMEAVLSQSAVCHAENGNPKVTGPTLAAIARALVVTAGTLLGEDMSGDTVTAGRREETGTE